MEIDISRIENGWDVYGSDGEKIGDVHGVGSNYVEIRRGFLNTKTSYVPVSAIASIEQDRVTLNVAKDQVDDMGWDELPAETATTTTAAATDTTVDTGTTTEEVTDQARIPRYEEELVAEKDEREAGRVRIAKDVEEEEESLDVPVTREEVRVRSRTVDRPATEADQPFTEEEVEVPVREEEVEVYKEPRVAEELEVTKEAREDTEPYTDTVRKERFDVEDTGDVEERPSDQGA